MKENILKLGSDGIKQVIAAYESECNKCTNTPCECGNKMSHSFKAAIEEIGLGNLKSKHASLYLEAKGIDGAKLRKIMKEKNLSAPEAMKEYHKMNKMDKKDSNKEKDPKGPKDPDDGGAGAGEVEEKEEKEASISVKKKAWAEYFDKKGWFQGSKEDSFEGKITSNNPEKLGYPKEVEYERKPMAVPVGGDSREWEQDWFEGAAKETKKDMGPSGEELKTKKEWLRAKWKNFIEKKSWFQGSEESVDKIVSNDPTKLGYPKDVEYERKPMAVPVGEDSRPWEQKWFEGAADKTKKVMGPSGIELTTKKEWLRAKWKGFLKKEAQTDGWSEYAYPVKEDKQHILTVLNMLQKQQQARNIKEEGNQIRFELTDAGADEFLANK
jgi:hypothetical protein